MENFYRAVCFYLVDLGTTDIDGLTVPEANRYERFCLY